MWCDSTIDTGELERAKHDDFQTAEQQTADSRSDSRLQIAESRRSTGRLFLLSAICYLLSVMCCLLSFIAVAEEKPKDSDLVAAAKKSESGAGRDSEEDHHERGREEVERDVDRVCRARLRLATPAAPVDNRGSIARHEAARKAAAAGRRSPGRRGEESGGSGKRAGHDRTELLRGRRSDVSAMDVIRKKFDEKKRGARFRAGGDKKRVVS